MLEEELRKLKPKRVALLIHLNADPDALCAAYALKRLLESSKLAKARIIAPEGVSRLSKQVADEFRIRFYDSGLNSCALAILVDTATLEQLGDLGGMLVRGELPYVMIDHHTPHPKTVSSATLCLIDSSLTSSCELVYRIYAEMGAKLTSKVATALLTGILYDTRGLLHANDNTIEVVYELIRAGGSLKRARSALRVEVDFSERVARLKAAQRLELSRVDDLLLAFSHVSSYEASAARSFIALGADLAVVVGGKEGEVRISLRCSEAFRRKTGIHLGRDLAEKLGEMVGGMGGGHATAAGVNGVGDPESFLPKCREFVEEVVKSSLLEKE